MSPGALGGVLGKRARDWSVKRGVLGIQFDTPEKVHEDRTGILFTYFDDFQKDVFFKSFKGLPRGGSRPILRISQKRLGGSFGCQGGGSGGRVHETGRVWEGPGPSQKRPKCVFHIPWKLNVDIYDVF